MENRSSDIIEILEKIYKERGFDFRQYKETSLERRLQKRLHALNLKSYRDYLVRLGEEPAEYDRLIDTLLINVTEFFRDRDAFEVIRDKVLPDVIACKTGARPELKIWSAGCASGEEAYSMAILLSELSASKEDNFEFSVYGTDIDKDSLEKAKEGAYRTEPVNGKITGEILDKYFVKNDSLRIKDSVKKTCRFSFHDLVLGRPLKAVELDGLSVVRMIRHNQAMKAVPILAVSASAMPHNVKGALDAGCSDFIAKPVKPGLLREKVRDRLKME